MIGVSLCSCGLWRSRAFVLPGAKVGVMAFEPALLAGGYVTDILLTITFKTEVWEEAHLGTLRSVLPYLAHPFSV